MSRHIVFAGLCIALLSASSALADPKCDGAESWPAAMTHVHLKNAGVLVNDEVDFDGTVVQQIASQQIDQNLYREGIQDFVPFEERHHGSSHHRERRFRGRVLNVWRHRLQD
jgi:hypothetical protein